MQIDALPDFWSRMPLNVHPQDKPVLDRYPGHGFNIRFPPPAFIGDILRAKVIILLNNGAYKPGETESEFPDARHESAYRNKLAHPRPIDEKTAPYYHRRCEAKYLSEGTAAILNAVAYRSKGINERHVRKLSEELPSAKFHRKWLSEALWPEVRDGRRFVVVHNYSLWHGADNILRESENAVGWSGLRSTDLTYDEFRAMSEFLTSEERSV